MINVIVDLLNDRNPGELPQLSVDNWDTVTVTAIAIGVAPLLHARLEDSPLMVPPMAMAKLGVTRQAHEQRNKAIKQQLADILRACHKEEIQVIVLKGALLAQLFYADASLRPMNDIDLLFQPESLPQVAAILEGLGYQGKYKSAELGAGITKHLSTYRRLGGDAATPNPYLSAGGDRTIEPHGSLEESWFGLRVDITPGIWQRVEPVELSQQPAFRLGSEDLLIHLAVHATFHVIMGAAVFVQLYDIGQVADGLDGQLNWDRLLVLSRQAQAQSFVYAAFCWASRLFGAPLPAPGLAALRQDVPPRLLGYIHSIGPGQLFKRMQQPPLHTVSQRVRRGLSDRREAARWAGSLAGKWQVWRTALAVHKTDTAGLLLGRELKTSL
jgi:hypothetical protein